MICIGGFSRCVGVVIRLFSSFLLLLFDCCIVKLWIAGLLGSTLEEVCGAGGLLVQMG